MAADRLDADEVPAGTTAGQPNTPQLTLDGFTGSLERLLFLARAQQIDLAQLSLARLIDQLIAALHQASPATPLSQKGNWVVMTAWLVQLRSRLLLPPEELAQQEAVVAANQLRGRLGALQAMQGLTDWLELRPQLGHEVWARGRPEVFNTSVETTHSADVVEFLWASLALFDDTAWGPEPTARYRPVPLNLHVVAEARDRIRRWLAGTPGTALLDQLLPDTPIHVASDPMSQVRRRSAWSSTLIASLELARQGEVVLRQEANFHPIYIGKVSNS